MKEIADGLAAVVRAALPRLREIDDRAASQLPAPGRWCKKEIIGHLIDSAANNHHRFVRAQYTRALHFPPYDQNQWVRIQRYRERSWTELVDLWGTYNQHLADVIRNLPGESGELLCWIGDDPPMSLAELAIDYVKHLRHHLKQVGVEWTP